MTFIWPEHDEFQQAPAKHLSGRRCASCGGRVQLTTQRFIDKSRQAHGDRYDYSARGMPLACAAQGATFMIMKVAPCVGL